MGRNLRKRKLFAAYNAAIEGINRGKESGRVPGMSVNGCAFGRHDGRGFDSGSGLNWRWKAYEVERTFQWPIQKKPA